MAVLLPLMDWLEATKKELGSNEAVSNEVKVGIGIWRDFGVHFSKISNPKTITRYTFLLRKKNFFEIKYWDKKECERIVIYKFRRLLKNERWGEGVFELAA